MMALRAQHFLFDSGIKSVWFSPEPGHKCDGSQFHFHSDCRDQVSGAAAPVDVGFPGLETSTSRWDHNKEPYVADEGAADHGAIVAVHQVMSNRGVDADHRLLLGELWRQQTAAPAHRYFTTNTKPLQ